MKKYFAPELETAKFHVTNVIAASGQTAEIIGGDNANNDDVNSNYNGVINFDWNQANWD